MKNGSFLAICIFFIAGLALGMIAQHRIDMAGILPPPRIAAPDDTSDGNKVVARRSIAMTTADPGILFPNAHKGEELDFDLLGRWKFFAFDGDGPPEELVFNLISTNKEDVYKDVSGQGVFTIRRLSAGPWLLLDWTERPNDLPARLFHTYVYGYGSLWLKDSAGQKYRMLRTEGGSGTRGSKTQKKHDPKVLEEWGASKVKKQSRIEVLPILPLDAEDMIKALEARPAYADLALSAYREAVAEEEALLKNYKPLGTENTIRVGPMPQFFIDYSIRPDPYHVQPKTEIITPIVVPRMEYVHDFSGAETIPAPKPSFRPRMPNVDKIDGHPIDLPEFVFPKK